MYEVVLHPDAEALYINLDCATAKKVARCFLHLEQNPRNYPNIKPLKGDFAGIYRFRTENYRVLYTIAHFKKQASQRIFQKTKA